MLNIEVQRGGANEEFGISATFNFRLGGRKFLIIDKYFQPYLHHQTRWPSKLGGLEGEEFALGFQGHLDNLGLDNTFLRYKNTLIQLESPFNLANFIVELLPLSSPLENLPLKIIRRRLNRIFWNLAKV